LIEDALCKGKNGEDDLSFNFKMNIYQELSSFETNPLYIILHESIYCQGEASNWSAERMVKKHKCFSEESKPLFFFGEHIFPWSFEDWKELKPLKEAAEILAKKSDWPPLYDIAQLQKNQVPCASLSYFNDMFVNIELVQETVSKIKGCKLWVREKKKKPLLRIRSFSSLQVTSQYSHHGISEDGSNVVYRLYRLAKGEIDR